MKTTNVSTSPIFRPTLALLSLACGLILAAPALARQTPPAATPEKAEPAAGKTNAVAAGTNSTSGTNLAAEPKPEKGGTNEDIQLSFQGANIDMVLQWLAQTTGKSVMKHPQVNCQLTIINSKKMPPREAIKLVYRALALEGFSAVESADSITIVPEGKEPKMSPVLLKSSNTEIPEGRQKLIKIFTLKHAQAEDLRDKIRLVLSDKAVVDTDARANQLIVTDYNDNLRMLTELMTDLDVGSAGDTTIEILPVKHSDAEEVGNLMNLILNVASAAPKSHSSRSSHANSGMPPGMSLPPGVSFPGGDSPPSGGDSDSGSGGPQGVSIAAAQIRIWPDKIANRLIVSAPKSRMTEVRNLLDVLDTDKSKDVTIRLLTLKNVSARDLMREIGPLYQRMGERSGKERVEISADEQANALIVFSSEANFKSLQAMIAGLDTEDSQEKVMTTFPLKNADAQDVAKQLQDLNSDQGNPFARYYYYGGDQPGGKKKMTVVADRRRNSVIIQAPPGQLAGITKMISDLDAPVSDGALAPRIYALKYVSATDIEDVLNELFLKKQQQRNYYDYFDMQEPTADRDVGRLYGKVRITSEPYSNTIIVTSNSKESLAAVEDVLKQLDRPSPAGETTVRVGLRFAKAMTLANSLNILFAKGGSPPIRPNGQPNQQNPQNNQPGGQQNQPQSLSPSGSGFDLEQETKEDGYFPWVGGQPETTRGADGRNTTRPVSDLVGRVRVVPDQRSNSLLISANAHFLSQVLKLVEELDESVPSVLIEARIVEVSTDNLDQLGVRWSPNGSTFTANDQDNSLMFGSTGQYTKSFGGANSSPNTGQAGTTTSGIAQDIFNSMRSGVVNNSISLDFIVQFLHETTHATVLAAPQINIKDNEMGRLFVGQRVPTPQNSSSSPQTGVTITGVVYENVGVILEVTPHINNSGDVELKIHAESSSIVPGLVGVAGGDVFDSRAFKTDLTAKNGQTRVLGGIIQKQISETNRKTPYLSSIPGLGWAFKKNDKTAQEVELFVFLRPRIVRDEEDAKTLMREVDQKAPLVKKWQEENGPRNPFDRDQKLNQK